VIETVHSNESGDADKVNKVQNTFKMPKNIRQVGKSNANKKIYVEDYVMTFIKQLAGGDFTGCKIAVLVGQCVRIDNCRNIFISGAVEVKDVDAIGEIVFSNDTWTAIYEDIKKYFVDTEIVGWFIGGPGYLLEDDDKILKAHVDNFAGQDKTLLTYDNMEKEEAFLSYENSRLCKQDGYYIYYEKNEEMQTYMIDHKTEEVSSEINYDDCVSRDIRTVLQNKKPAQEENKSVNRLMYAAGTLLAVIVLVVGAAMLGNYDQMKSMKDTLDYLTKNMQDVQAIFAENEISQENDASKETMATNTSNEGAEDADKENQGLDVEVAPGNVESIEDDQSDGENTENNEDNEDSEDNEEDQEETSSGEELAEDTEESAKPTNPPKKTEEKDADKQTSPKDEVKYYTVVSGDTLAGISYKLYNTYTKKDEIMKLNNIVNQDYIFVGQKLIVP
jgi:LysM repeat protein